MSLQITDRTQMHSPSPVPVSSAHRRLHQRLESDTAKTLPTTTQNAETSRRPLNNARTDVIITLETLPDLTVKHLFRVIYVAIVLGVFALIALMVAKLVWNSKLVANNVILISNTVTAGMGLTALAFCFGCYFHRIYLVNKRKLNWSPRRRKGAILFSIELITQIINLCSYLGPNFYVLAHECGWHDSFVTWIGFIRMTCWNTLFLLFLVMSSNYSFIKDEKSSLESGRNDTTLDLPFWYHTPKLILWLLTEALLMGLCLQVQIDDFQHSRPSDAPKPCTGTDFNCALTPTLKNVTIVVSVCFIVYFLGTIYYFRRGFQHLSQKQYLNYRLTNILIRLHLRMQMIVHTFHLFSFALLWFVHINTCASFVLSWFGFLPSQFAMTVIVCVKSYLFIPLKPTKDDFTLEMWLREYSWSEEELPKKMEKRGNGYCNSLPTMFCFERAVKTLYWSTFIYDFKQVPDSKLSLKTAMHLYDLTEYELFHESLHDTKLLVAWNDKMALLAFRGTSSLKNVLADLRVARIPHPPIRGKFMRKPMVHRGFLETWCSNDLNKRVLELLQEISKDKPDFQVLLTGHSLGGALATLAAYDIRVHLNKSPCHIACYTFGAPRVGNYAFAYDYNRQVPNTWHVINDQDYITRTMKFIGMYKRPGQRVIINSTGDMLVRPSFIEMSLSRTTGAVNLAHHLLGSYQKAFLSIARAQFSEDSIEGGYEGMLSISNTLRHVLGVSRARLIQELNWGSRIKELELKKKVERSRVFYAIHISGQYFERFRHFFFNQIDAAFKRFQNPQKKAEMDGICLSTTRVCGGQNCEVIGMEMEEVNGLSLEVGHVSLESQRTQSEKAAFTSETDLTEQERNLATSI